MAVLSNKGSTFVEAVFEDTMTFTKTTLAALALLSGMAAHASAVNLAADDQWNAFTVDGNAGSNAWLDYNDGSVVNFNFTVAAGYEGSLMVVDSVFAGDTFRVYNNGNLLGDTSAVAQTTYDGAWASVFDYDAALSDVSFSRGVFTLGAGSYSITGTLLQSVLQQDAITAAVSPINATEGAVKLSLTSVSAVPEPSAFAMLLAALGVMWLVARRLPSGR
jgi:hypothetical protein